MFVSGQYYIAKLELYLPIKNKNKTKIDQTGNQTMHLNQSLSSEIFGDFL